MAVEPRKLIKPQWAYGATDHVRRFLMHDDVVFEWGAGESTIWLAQRVKRVISVESDPQRYADIAIRLGGLGLTNATVYFVTGYFPFARAILAWKRKFHLLAINDHQAGVETAMLAVKKSFRGSLIVAHNSENPRAYHSIEYLTDWTRKGGRRESYISNGYGDEVETSVYSRG